MVKKIVLAVAFVASFSAVGLSYTKSAQAWRDWGRPNTVYYGAYAGPRTAYYAPYNSYYAGPVVGGPVVAGPVVVAPRPYRAYYAAPAGYYYGPSTAYSYGY